MPTLEDPKLEFFCQECAKADASNARAYVAAGYVVKSVASAKAHISRLLRDAKVSARIAEIRALARSLNDITPDRTLQKLARMAFVDVRKAVKRGAPKVWAEINKVTGTTRIVFSPGRETMVDISELDDDTAAAITNIRQHKNGAITYAIGTSMTAMILLGKHVGMWPNGNGRWNSGRGHADNVRPNEPLVYVDAAPRETREQWEARQKIRMAGLAAAKKEKHGKGEADQASH